MNIPHAATVREDTGLYNGKLGIWLFIASQAMLFGGLISAYVFLRNGVPDWPSGADALDVPLGSAATFVLIASSITIAAGWAAIKRESLAKFRIYFVLTALLSLAFIGIKSYEGYQLYEAGNYPATHNFFAIYYVLTATHAIHLAGGFFVVAYQSCCGTRIWDRDPARFVNRIEVTGLYWHFVTLVWIVIFSLVYLA